MTQLGKIVFGPAAKDLDKFFVGFDEQWNRMAKFHDDVTKNIQNYPPYNIKKTDDNNYVIEIAVAGFSQSDIDIELNDGKLIVHGNTVSEDAESNYLFKGIANRSFTRSFVLDEQIVVKDAELLNGMLTVFLERVIPEHKKPRKIEVKTKGEPKLLTE